MSRFPESWKWKRDEEIEADLRSYASEHGVPYPDDTDDIELTEEDLKRAREIRWRVHAKFFGEESAARLRAEEDEG